MLQGIDYTPDEWATSTGHRPLALCTGEELLLLHRHWMWANVQRLEFDKLLGTEELGEPGPMMMVSRSMAFMFVWYGLLWSTVESLLDRKIDIRGSFGADIAAMSEALRRCRNAVMHVPRKNALLDHRIETLVTVGDSPATLRRIHGGIGRLFREEFQRQTAESQAAAALAPPPSQA